MWKLLTLPVVAAQHYMRDGQVPEILHGCWESSPTSVLPAVGSLVDENTSTGWPIDTLTPQGTDASSSTTDVIIADANITDVPWVNNTERRVSGILQAGILPEDGACDPSIVSLRFSLADGQADITTSHCQDDSSTSRISKILCYCPDGSTDCDKMRMMRCSVGEIEIDAEDGLRCAYYSLGGNLTWRQYTPNYETLPVRKTSFGDYEARCLHWGEFEADFQNSDSKYAATFSRAKCTASDDDDEWLTGAWLAFGLTVASFVAILVVLVCGTPSSVSKFLDDLSLSGETRNFAGISDSVPRSNQVDLADDEEHAAASEARGLRAGRRQFAVDADHAGEQDSLALPNLEVAEDDVE